MNSSANRTQREAWNGDSGQRWIADPDRRDRAMAAIATTLADAAGLQAGEKVLDIGCGCGATTLAAAQAVTDTGALLGVDISEPMLSVARARLAASGRSNVTFRNADAQTDPLPEKTHDVTISRFGTMFFDDPVAAFTNIAASLRAGGRLCIATWQPMTANDWLAIPVAALLRYARLPEPSAAPGMFAQSDPAIIISVLTAAGWEDIETNSVTVSLRLGADAVEATGYMADTGIARTVLDAIEPAHLDRALEDVTAVLASHTGPKGVELNAGIWITTARTRR